jgi:uncharacterized LabA/DUF88 family protein
MQMQMKRTAILVDGSNVHSTMSRLGFTIDYSRLLKHFHVSLAYYFTALPPKDEQSTIRPLVDYLEYNEWSIIQKEWKELRDSRTGEVFTKGNMDVEIAVLAKEIAKNVDTLYLMSGDGDFRFLIESLQRHDGVRVIVISSKKAEICADSLRRQANKFIEIEEIRDKIERDPEDRRKVYYARS